MLKTKNKVIILLGANLGDKLATFSKVKLFIAKIIGNCIKQSSIYKSKPWGFTSNDEFINQILVVETTLTAHETLINCQDIENQCGRIRHIKEGYESRTIDIDIIYWNNEIIDMPDLKVPHPLLQERNFTLKPLCEIMPEYIHPLLKKSNSTLLSECNDKSIVEQI